MKSVLNAGRCSRCIAGKKKIHHIGIFDEEKLIGTKCAAWLQCAVKNDKWCRYCAMNCKEPPMGISAGDYAEKMKGVK